jgi:competence protein ComGF
MDTKLIRQRGMTFLTVLFSLATLSIMVPFFPYIFNMLDQPTYHNELSVQQFFQFVIAESYNTKNFSIETTTLTLEKWDGSSVTIGSYQDLVRRQVSGLGHEVLLRNVKSIEFSKIPFGVKIIIINLLGEEYEKVVYFIP